MTSYEQSVLNYIVKAIEELYFEDLLEVALVDGIYTFSPTESISYLFQGQIGAFDNLWIEKKTFKKLVNSKEANLSVADFIREIQPITRMDDITESQFIEEANQTLFSDVIFKERFESLKNEILDQDFHHVDACLPGHPKILNNKGRIGWGATQLEQYAPEAIAHFKLHWVAVLKEYCIWGGEDQVFAKNAFSEQEFESLSIQYDLDKYTLVPVHPWQWDRYIRIHYADLISRNEIISLGEVGPTYGAQTSIRTLSNLDQPKKTDMKLSVSILNTSIVRGIPRRFIENGHEVSELIQDVINRDSFLSGRVRIAKEIGALSVTSPSFEPIAGAPPRFKEMLGCICRESVPFLLNENERALPVAALFFNLEGFCFLKELIKKSELSAVEWMKLYFDNVVIPLYHLQLSHGIGIVAHGQNVVLILENNKPSGIILKDFHGDLRLSSTSHLLENNSVSSLTVLPPEHLIHDLITGHFVTVLRYISRSLAEYDTLREEIFYQILAESVDEYFNKNLITRPGGALSLLREDFEKLQVNNVRFVVGYKESIEPLKPLVGKNIRNPLFKYRNWSMQ